MSDMPKEIYVQFMKDDGYTGDSFIEIEPLDHEAISEATKYTRQSPDDIVISREWLEKQKMQPVVKDGAVTTYKSPKKCEGNNALIDKILTMGGKDE